MSQCNLCDSPDSRLVFRAGEYEIRECRQCHLAYTHPKPTREDVVRLNQEQYSSSKQVEGRLKCQRLFAERAEQRLREIEREVRRVGRLLDVGCNIGVFLSVAKSRGWDVHGVELNSRAADFARSHFGLNVSTGELHEANYPADSFDVITLWDVLEHVYQPKDLLQTAGRILKPDGLLVIQSPNFASIMARLTGARWSWLTPPDHLNHFSPQSLPRLLTVSGYRMVSLRTWEPAQDFTNNVLNSFTGDGASVAHVFLRRAMKVMSFLLSPGVRAVQPIWWRRGEGGLLLAFAARAS